MYFVYLLHKRQRKTLVAKYFLLKRLFLFFSILSFLSVSCDNRKNVRKDVALRRFDSDTYAIIWVSEDGESFDTKLLKYQPGFPVTLLGTSPDPYFWADHTLWTLTHSKSSVREGDCSTKGGSRDVDKLFSYLQLVSAPSPLDPNSLPITRRRSKPRAESTTTSQILGSAGRFVFTRTCTYVKECFSSKRYTTCEAINYDLLTRKKIPIRKIVSPDPLPKQKKKFAHSERYPAYVIPTWNEDGLESMEAFYRIKLKTKKALKKIRYQSIHLDKEYIRLPLDLDIPPALAEYMLGHRYAGISLVPVTETIDWGQFFIMDKNYLRGIH